MNPELDRLLERMRQRRAQRASDLLGTQAPPTPPDARPGLVHPLGSRVFDPVTGQEGTVIGDGAENVVVSTAK